MFKFLLTLFTIQGLLVSATIKHITINNQEIPVIFEKQTALPTFNLQFVFQNSGYIQDGGKSGLCSLSSALLNEGTKKLGSIGFANKLESKAISLSVAHGFETFVIELSSLTNQYDSSLKLLNQLLDNPNYTQDTLDKIKTKAIGSLKRKENDFDYTAQNQLKTLLFEGTPLQNSSKGTIETLQEIKLKDIEKFIQTNLTLNNLIVVVGGDVTFKEIKQDIKKIIQTLPQGEKKQLLSINASNQSKDKVLLRQTQQAYIYFGSPFDINAHHKNVHLAKVASFILGGSGFGSRLMEEIRVKRGLAYSAYGSVHINKSHSYFSGYLQTKLESAKEAQEIVKKEIKKFVQKGVTQDELLAAKKFLSGSEPLRTETLSQRQNRAFHLYYKGLPLDYPKTELKKIEQITVKELNAFIKKHDEINQLSFSIVKK
ncbi:MAG: pitrilysin family protein [Campylobacterota bacterium]|nr:pitrilysin family protein [Campylobacterota bacterium]